MLYCADVAGAFDRVSAERLRQKLRASGIHPKLLKLLFSWLEKRTAYVVVGGAKSRELSLYDMVYQGTVLGPALWNLFYADVRRACQKAGYKEVVFADDLHAYDVADVSIPNEKLLTEAAGCQTEVHTWGDANGVFFESTKESFRVLSRSCPHGEDMNMLGVEFDTGLYMDVEISGLAAECSWKLASLTRSHRFFSDYHTVQLYKAHILSYLEYRTAAIYHASSSRLQSLDSIQRRALRMAGMTEHDALMHCKLAPLQIRRDLGMLGIIHRCVLGKGPAHFKEIFKRSEEACTSGRTTRLANRRHGLQLQEYRGSQNFIKQSILGLVTVYNLLPARIVEGCKSVRNFQGALQQLVKDRATAGMEDWETTFSPRLDFNGHPLLGVC